jgi:hypothetical protein
MALEHSTNPMDYGQRITLDIVPRVTGTPIYRKIVSARFDDEHKVEPITVLISEARLISEVQGVGAGNDCTGVYHDGDPPPPATYPVDWQYSQIKAVVEWKRGGAEYALECDPGACFVIPASSVNISARIDVNLSPRYLSASVTRGAVPRANPLASPKYTSMTITTKMLAAGVVSPSVGLNRFRIPPFARSFRAGTISDSAVCVTPYAQWQGTRLFQELVAGRIWVSSWDEVHPIPSRANNLYVVSARPNDDVMIEFQLGL